MRRLALALAVPLALAAPGCGPSSAPFRLALSWRFADGRRCAEAGVMAVAVTLAGQPVGPEGGHLCERGEPPSSQMVEGEGPTDKPLVLVGRSAQGAALYRGELSLPRPWPSQAMATLTFRGGG